MGSNTSSRSSKDSKDDDRDDVKRQINHDPIDAIKQIYTLVDVKTGGGKLIKIIKAHVRQRSTTFSSTLAQGPPISQQQPQQDSIDDRIRALVEPLLYNGGRGKLVPLAQLWSCRFGRLLNEDLNDHLEAVATHKSTTTRYRWVCWKLEERGFVGETALHICFLLSTPTHMILARKLLEIFPMLINDIYTCDEYFGESSLHMAIVNEHVDMVKLLLDQRANVHERCLGTFFLPEDQKAKVNKMVRKRHFKYDGLAKADLDQWFDLQSNHHNSLETNYEGYTYWGEYPLSFAASLGLVDCYRLLLARGADPNRRDSNGNSTLHICVIANRTNMFDLCYSTGADLNAFNKLGLSPLSLAARLRRVDMFFHILTIQRQVSWVFCNVGFVDYPLMGIDSINTQTFACDEQSLLTIVVSGTSSEHLQMLDGVLSDLLQVKWDTSLRQSFYSWLSLYVVLLIIALLAYITRFIDEEQRRNMAKIRILNQVCEALLVGGAIYYSFILVKVCNFDQASSSAVGLIKMLIDAPELFPFALSCCLTLICIPLRLISLKQWEDSLASIIMFLLPFTLLFFCRGSKSLGSFVVMIYKIVVRDLFCFYVFFLLFAAGFGQSFVIILKTYRPRVELQTDDKPQSETIFESLVRGEDHLLNLFDVYITMIMLAHNEFSWFLDELNATDHPSLAKVFLCIYLIFVSILLINMMIAMLSKTYEDIKSQPNENLRQWARALLTLERVSSRSSRLRMLDKYSHFVEAQQCRCYSSTWALKLHDLDEIHRIHHLKEDQVLNKERVRARLIREKRSILSKKAPNKDGAFQITTHHEMKTQERHEFGEADLIRKTLQSMSVTNVNSNNMFSQTGTLA